MKKLTIVIPTYNRPERLIRQVKAIVSDPDFEKIALTIVDNHSPYDVVETIRGEVTAEQYNQITIRVRQYNLGLGLNISLPFIECDSQWVWILGDDDKFIGKISQLLNDIESYDYCSWIKYNISNSRRQQETEISNINDFLNYYTDLHPTGDLVFISNTLFNLNRLNNYRQLAVIWHHTLVGHVLPVIQALCDGNAVCKFRDIDLIEYQTPPTGTGYGMLWVTMGLSNLGDVEFTNNYSLNRNIHEMFQHDVKQISMINTVMQHKGRRYRKYCYKRIKSVFYSRIKLGNILNNCVFDISNITGINIAKSIIVLKKSLLLMASKTLKGIAEPLKNKHPHSYYKLLGKFK